MIFASSRFRSDHVLFDEKEIDVSDLSNVEKHQKVCDLEPGAKLDDIYHLTSVEQRTKKNGEPFFMLQLSDASGTLNTVMWDHHEDLVNGTIVTDNFVHIIGDVADYKNRLQGTLRRINLVDDTDVSLMDFLPVSPRPRDEMEKELDEWIAKVENNDCKRLLDKLFGHPKLRELFCTAPAAARIHQAYVHGLLEHSLVVMNLAWSIASNYEPVNRDLLITGCLLHDIGKIRELEWKRVITYTTEGRLLGHIPMGSSMVDALINELRRKDGFDPEIQFQLVHMLLSHHGKLEWGSPITPKTREALILHYADHAEAYMSAFDTEVRQAADRSEPWTNWSRMFDSYLYVGKDLLEQNEKAPAHPTLPTGQGNGPMDDVNPVK
jgi:3'-5' exoribonuclease